MAEHAAPLVWIDLEMTGLDPASCHIVQLGMIITNSQLEQLGDPYEVTIWQPDAVLDQMSPFVRRMHEKSGLLPQIRASETGLREAEQETMARITAVAEYRKAILCGNSIHSDRKFLDAYMPQLSGYLHYRMIDVSGIKELARSWYDLEYSKPELGQHTALADIQQSIEELRFYRSRIFR
ncbi:MAG: oligoribonuclease [Deltaproteobacteria bacterium]|nr:oligoribonuclease [Deltaproteobacteria bacterium]